MKIKHVFCAVACSVAVVMLAGCEDASTKVVIVVTPADAAVDVRGAVTLSASVPAAEAETRNLYYPLVWTVSNPEIGGLRDVAGNSAVYFAGNVAGVNTVTVRDQAGAEGIASVTQQ